MSLDSLSLESLLSCDSELSLDSVLSWFDEPLLSRATALTHSPWFWSPVVGQSWAADDTSAPWLSGCSDDELLDESGADELEESVDDELLSVESADDSVSSDFVSEDVSVLVPVEELSVDCVEPVVGAVKGEPATAKAAPPINSTVAHAMTMASCFFMRGASTSAHAAVTGLAGFN